MDCCTYKYNMFDRPRLDLPVQGRVAWVRAKPDVWSRPVESGRNTGQRAGQQVGHTFTVRSTGPQVQIQHSRFTTRPAR